MSPQPNPVPQTLTLKVQRDDDGTFFATLIELPGFNASGLTFGELMDHIEEAISDYIVALGHPRPHVEAGPEIDPETGLPLEVEAPLAEVVPLRPRIQMADAEMKVLVD